MNPRDLMHLGLRLLLRKRVGLSIDITNRCTLSCKTCYMKWYKSKEDLPIEEWETIIEKIPEQERLLCAWTGGEPFLRIDDIKKLVRFFKWNWVATNGTLPLEKLPRTTILVSVDGTEEIHNRIRGKWENTVDNIIKDCYIAYDITSKNSSREILEETIKFWNDKVNGVIFSFYTPRVGEDSPLYMNMDEKIKTIDTIEGLKALYGDFIVNPINQLYYSIRPENNCQASETLLALDAQGNVKKPCVLGEEVDCIRCGCAVSSFMKFKPSIIKEGIRVLGGFKSE